MLAALSLGAVSLAIYFSNRAQKATPGIKPDEVGHSKLIV